MRRLLVCLVCVVCLSLGSRVLAQDDHYGQKAQDFLKAYFSVQDPTQYAEVLPTPLGDDFETESVFCSDTPPTEFEILPLNEEFPDMESFILVKRLLTDQGVLYVVFRDFERMGNIEEVVQQVICEDSAAGQALKAVVTNEILCGQADPPWVWIEGHWTNRAGDRALVRFHSMYRGHSIFVYVRREGDAWTFDKGLCGYDAEGQAMSLITEYMHDYPDSFYYMGSMDTPVFAEITSVQGGGYDDDQATILIQLETQQDEKDVQDDPVCMLKLRTDPGWVVYETRCIS